MQSMGNVLAWAQLRSASQQGAAPPDKLMEFAASLPQQPLLDYAEGYAKQVLADWQAFAAVH